MKRKSDLNKVWVGVGVDMAVWVGLVVWVWVWDAVVDAVWGMEVAQSITNNGRALVASPAAVGQRSNLFKQIESQTAER